MTASGADRFRNYSDVLQRHERDVRIKKMLRAFMMFLIILVLIALIFFLSQVEEQAAPEGTEPIHSSMYAPDSPSTP